MNTCLILPEKPSPLLKDMIEATLGNDTYDTVSCADDIVDLKNKRIVFAVELDEIGVSNNLNIILKKLYSFGKESLKGCIGAVLIHSNYNAYTKTTAQSIILLANNLGCTFIGRPLVEATGNLDNFMPMVKIYKLSLEQICLLQCRELGERLIDSGRRVDQPQREHQDNKKKKMLVLHSSNWETSNTFALWDMVRKNIKGVDINIINLGNGQVLDCIGCSYTVCKHYGLQEKCYYGGIVVEEVYPAILEADSILFLCPNYNDMVVANLVATINRLTALFRKTKFYDKTIFSIIVSGHSGGDAIAKQLISAMNINKTMKLPPYFSLLATANDAGAIFEVEGIEGLAKEFAENIMENI